MYRKRTRRILKLARRVVRLLIDLARLWSELS